MYIPTVWQTKLWNTHIGTLKPSMMTAPWNIHRHQEKNSRRGRHKAQPILITPENGIHDAHIAAAIFIQYSRHKADEVDGRLDEHDEEFSAEVGTVTLTNTNSGFFAFNNSGSTVALTKTRKTMNYDITIEVTSFSGGQLGEVEIYDKQLNGFKLKFTGSAKSVTVKYKVRGGMCA